jgi:hypothetical protein
MQEPESYLGEIRAMAELQAKLIAAIEDLLEAYESFVAGAPEGVELTLSAGPFESTASVREFERQLAGLASVRAVDVRGYEGEDRAIFHVELERESPLPPTP